MPTPGLQPLARHLPHLPDLARTTLAGLVAAVVLLANIVSFAALMFPGPLAVALPAAIWALLLGSGVCGLWIAWRTSLPPLSTGVDSATGAVMVGMSAAIAAPLLAGGMPAASVATVVMVAFTAGTLAGGLLQWGLGAARLGPWLRFIPYFVVAGFLAATGLLLVAGGLRMATGRSGWALLGPWAAEESLRLAVTLAVLGGLLVLRWRVKSPYALPGLLLAASLALLAWLQASGRAAPAQGWMLPSLGTLVPWWPWQTANLAAIDLPLLARVLPEVVAVAIIAVVSLATKAAALEVGRQRAADLDCELRAHGAGALAAAAAGGWIAGLQLGTSRLLDQTGGAGRGSGIVTAAVLLAVGLLGVDLPALVPVPVAAGLVLYLGWVFLAEALARPLAQRAIGTVLLALAIALACVRFGFLAGVLGGIVAACISFAVGYARVGAVRWQLSRAQYPGQVVRSPAAARHLAQHGDTVQLYGLAGYLFFGSSEGVVDRVRGDLARAAVATGATGAAGSPVRWVVLDFAGVTGADASVGMSLLKLERECARRGVALLMAALPPPVARLLARDGVGGAPGLPPPFPDVHEALAWCEDRLLQAAGVDADGSAHTPPGRDDGDGAEASFSTWLQDQLGPQVPVARLLAVLQRRDFAAAQALYREGEPADQIDLVAAGRLVVQITRPDGQVQRLRRTDTHTVVGEMGFFRRLPRSATVACEGPAVVYTLARTAYEALQRDDPALAEAFTAFVLRTLADRLALVERAVEALRR